MEESNLPSPAIDPVIVPLPPPDATTVPLVRLTGPAITFWASVPFLKLILPPSARFSVQLNGTVIA